MTAPDPPASQEEPSAGLCSRLSARRGLPLIGTAGSYDAILVFEFDPPWTARLAGSRSGDPALDEAIVRIAEDRPDVRLLAVEPEAKRDGRVRVLHLLRDEGPFREYSRREYEVDRSELAATLERCASGTAGEGGRIACAQGLRDILVCTHGARDACCGKFGYGLYREFSALAGRRPAADPPLRVWRSSHLGGHRFAPTILDLPSGRMFGRLSHGDAAAVLDGGDALASRLAAIYRGRCALPDPVQIVERELWSRCGADFPAEGLRWQADRDGEGWQVRLEAAGGAAGTRSLEARVLRLQVEAVLTPASCGRDPESEAPWKLFE